MYRTLKSYFCPLVNFRLAIFSIVVGTSSILMNLRCQRKFCRRFRFRSHSQRRGTWSWKYLLVNYLSIETASSTIHLFNQMKNNDIEKYARYMHEYLSHNQKEGEKLEHAYTPFFSILRNDGIVAFDTALLWMSIHLQVIILFPSLYCK